ncbi:hypothetical protein B7494_g7667 [Chlorociboria aeruginascens]|nr:hypothetical protein B7494_g7667 [Chlorociboria aeruginascens]
MSKAISTEDDTMNSDSTSAKKRRTSANRPSLRKKSLTTISELTVHQSEDQLIIRLDFSTTFSGIAYAFAHNRKPDLVCIVDWFSIFTNDLLIIDEAGGGMVDLISYEITSLKPHLP